MHIHTFTFSLKCCILINAFFFCGCKTNFLEPFYDSQGCRRAGEIHLSPQNHILTCQISPQGAGWGSIFKPNQDTIGPLRHRKNGLGVLKPQKPLPETRLSINIRYSPQLPSSLFSLPLFLSLSLHSYIYRIIIQMLGKCNKKNSKNKINKSSGSVVLLLKEHLSPALPLRVGVG